MKDGYNLIEQWHDVLFRRYQANLLWLALAGTNYDPEWWYWEDYLKGNKN